MQDNYQKFIALLLKDNDKDYLNEKSMSELYSQLLKFAKNQLNDSDLAQDAVQECLIGAIHHSDNFKGNSAFKSWVFAILKHKIADIIRDNQKYIELHSFDDNTEFELSVLAFNDKGRWQDKNTVVYFDNSWEYDEIENNEFWQVLEYCLERLKGEQARAFLMKEYIGLETEEICQALNISTQNYYVLLYRARMNLQVCLTRHWFDDERRK